jgi:hypothetical protein
MFSLLVACSCAGSAPNAETPDPAAGAEEGSAGATSDEDAGTSGAAAAGDDATSDTEQDSPKADSSTESSLGAGVNPKDVLLKEGTAFMLDVAESDPGKQAEERCAKRAKDDVAKKANCVSKAVNAMDREGITFDEDGGKWYYIRFGIKKGIRTTWNKVEVEVGEPSGTKVTLKTTGRDGGSLRKGAVPHELNFEIPDEYTVILQDPKRGRLVFAPKMGLLNDDKK